MSNMPHPGPPSRGRRILRAIVGFSGLALACGCGLAAHRNTCPADEEVSTEQAVTLEDAEAFAIMYELDDPAALTCEQVCREVLERDGGGLVREGAVGACSYDAPALDAAGSAIDGSIACEALSDPGCGD